jgi:hypothetical protein
MGGIDDVHEEWRGVPPIHGQPYKLGKSVVLHAFAEIKW